jgi:hypothetical protein
MSVQTQRIKNHEQYQAPNGWHFGMSDSSDAYYTHRMFTDKALYQDGKFGWECEVFWDRDGDDQHKVAFYQITKIRQNGDYQYGYPTHTGSFDTEAEALEYAIEKAQELR